MQDQLLSIVIPAASRDDTLGQCVAMLLRQRRAKAEMEIVIVWVGRGSPDLPQDERIRVMRAPGGPSGLRRTANPLLHGLRQETPGAARMVNMGLRGARGDVRIVLPPHCLPETDLWLEQMVEPLRDASVGAVVSQCAVDARAPHPLAERLLHGALGRRLLSRRGRPKDLSLVSGTGDAFRAAALAQVGLPAEADLPEPAEPVDLSVRLKAAGWRIVLSPLATVRYRTAPAERSLAAAFAGALEHGRADALLSRRHGVDWLGSRLYAAGLLSLLLLPAGLLSLPIAFLLALALLLWGLFLPLRLPLVHWEWPAAVPNVAVYAACILWIRHDWLPSVFDPHTWHPAIIRQWVFLAAMTASYVLIAALAGVRSGVRDAVYLRGRASALALMPLAMIWWSLAGLGFVQGYLLPQGASRSASG
jgi:hypothetical protein